MDIDVELDILATKIANYLKGPYVVNSLSQKWCRELLQDFVEQQQLLVDPLIDQIESLDNDCDNYSAENDDLLDQIVSLEDQIDDLKCDILNMGER